MFPISTTDVLVVGAGPAGLTLAADLLRRNIGVRLIDRAAAPATTSRATSLTPRTLEVLDDLGVAQALLDTGVRIRQAEAYQGSNLTFRLSFPDSDQTRFPFLLNNSQRQTEQVLTDLVGQLGGRVERESTLTAFRQDRRGVIAYVEGATGPEEIQAGWLVGADGGRSTVRSTLGIPFRGNGSDSDMEETIVLADLSVDNDLAPDRLYTWFNSDGALLAFPFHEAGRWRITAALSPTEEADGRFTEESLERFTQLYQRRTGDTTTRLTQMTGFSVYRVNQRVVDHYRRGRTLLIGDAAHVHTPAGGLGMNTGIQDAYSLGWRLALAIGTGNEAVVDDYERERRPIAEALLTSTGGLQRIYSIRSRRLQQVRDTALQVLLNLRPIRQAFFVGAGQLNLSYREPRRLPRPRGTRVGDRAPDGPATLWPHGGDTWLHDHLRGPDPVLLTFAGTRSEDGSHDELVRLSRQASRHVRVVHVAPVGTDVPNEAATVTLVDTHGALHRRYGAGGASSAVIRPDGHVAAINRLNGAADVDAVLTVLSPLSRGQQEPVPTSEPVRSAS